MLECESSEEEVEPRDPGTIATGVMAPSGAGPALYLTGDVGDEVAASSPLRTSPSGLAHGEFTRPRGSRGLRRPRCRQDRPTRLLLAGIGGDDTLTASGFPEIHLRRPARG